MLSHRPLLSKHSFNEKLFLTFLIFNNIAVLKITPIIGSLSIFSKFTTFNITFFQNLCLNTRTKDRNRIYSLFLRNFLDTFINLFGIRNSKTFYLISFLNFLKKMIYYLFSLPLRIVVLLYKTSLISLYLILMTSPMVILV